MLSSGNSSMKNTLNWTTLKVGLVKAGGGQPLGLIARTDLGNQSERGGGQFVILSGLNDHHHRLSRTIVDLTLHLSHLALD